MLARASEAVFGRTGGGSCVRVAAVAAEVDLRIACGAGRGPVLDPSVISTRRYSSSRTNAAKAAALHVPDQFDAAHVQVFFFFLGRIMSAHLKGITG